MNYKEIEKALRPLDRLRRQQERAEARRACTDGDPAWHDPGGLMQRSEVAEFLSVSVRTVQRMQARGTLTRIRVRHGGRFGKPANKSEASQQDEM